MSTRRWPSSRTGSRAARTCTSPTAGTPFASINFLIAHDGFTLADLTAYNDKHNDANGEGGADGDSNNSSWNCGAEGPTDDSAVLRLRDQQRRNLLATLLLSQGIPMLLGGDEMGRTQQGNNNAYCQDNEISWFDWAGRDAQLGLFTQRLIELRRRHPVLRRRRYFQGRPLQGSGVADIAWFRPDGTQMNDDDWQSGYAKSVAVFLNGEAIGTPNRRGEPVIDSSFLVIFNSHHEPIDFVLPGPDIAAGWIAVLDTTESIDDGQRAQPAETLNIAGRSIVVLCKTA